MTEDAAPHIGAGDNEPSAAVRAVALPHSPCISLSLILRTVVVVCGYLRIVCAAGGAGFAAVALILVVTGARPFTSSLPTALDVSLIAIIVAGVAVLALSGVGVFAEIFSTPHRPPLPHPPPPPPLTLRVHLRGEQEVVVEPAASAASAEDETPKEDGVVLVVVHPAGYRSIAQVAA